MIVQDVLCEAIHSPPIRKQIAPYPVYPTVSGAEGSCIGTGFITLWTGMPTGEFSDTGFVKYDAFCTGMVFVISGHEDYDKYEPEMVGRLLQLDAAEPEAKFNNVIDMMDWLNSD
jgi:hypothetical protein